MPLHMSKKMKIFYPVCQTYSPTGVKKSISKKGGQHAGGKWLIHDTKRRKDNQLQSLTLPCIIAMLSS